MDSNPAGNGGRAVWSNELDTIIRSTFMSQFDSLSSAAPYFTFPTTTNAIHYGSSLNPNLLSPLLTFNRGIDMFGHQQRLLSQFTFPHSNYSNILDNVVQKENPLNRSASLSSESAFLPTNRPPAMRGYLAPPTISSASPIVDDMSSSVERTNVNKNKMDIPLSQFVSQVMHDRSRMTRMKPFVVQRPTSTMAGADSSTSSSMKHSDSETRCGLNSAMLPVQPYYPSHFMKGTVIQLADGTLKSVEDLTTQDFVRSANKTEKLKLSTSIVTKIERKSTDFVTLHFSVGETKLKVGVEATAEHPFFVVDRGWSSCNPERSISLYGLYCSRLQVGDVCISLTHKDEKAKDANCVTTTSENLIQLDLCERDCRQIPSCDQRSEISSDTGFDRCSNKRNVVYQLTGCCKRRRRMVNDDNRSNFRKSRSLSPDISTFHKTCKRLQSWPSF